jgi:hypothetical protein
MHGSDGLTVRKRPGGVGPDGTRVEVEVRVPYIGLGRKIYHTPSDATYQIPTAHSHTSPHLLMCLIGEAVIGYREHPVDPVKWLHLRAGDCWRVEGGVTHQLMLKPDTIVASYVPPLSWLGHNEELEVLSEDWFADAPDEVRSAGAR